jgi:cell division protease FtsH
MVARNKTIRGVLLGFAVISALLISTIGLETYVGILAFLAQLGVSMVFMIGQFLLLFTFLSSTKTIETYPGDKGTVEFGEDYYGNEYLVKAVREWVASLSAEGKQALDEMGAEAINGILLEGPPGTGKTLLAQCLASDSNAAFFGVSGTDFQAMFVGVGPMKVMSIYRKARKAAGQYGAAIVFIDEIDAIGGSRGGVSGDQPTQGFGGGGGMFGGGGLGVLSKLLTELDGTKEISRRDRIRNNMRSWFGIPPIRTGLVLTIGATNRFSALDKALVRPGRIDKIIRVDAPDRTSREKIIEGYLRKVDHGEIDVGRLTDDTQGVTPAQLASAIQRGAPRHALNDGRQNIEQKDIESALQEDLVGLANPISDFDPIQKRQVAVHEAGHAVAARKLRPQRRITNVSIIRRGSGVLGYVRDVELKEIFAQPLSYYEKNIQVSMAGHVATAMVLGEPWTGGGSDFNNVRFSLNQMAMYGQLGGLPLDPQKPFANPATKRLADEKQAEMWASTTELLERYRPALDAITEALMEKEDLSSDEVYDILDRFDWEDEDEQE